MDQPAVNWTETQTAVIRTQLNRFLASPKFAQSKRLCRFLQFIVDRALDGGTDCLKGYTIAVEVFERPATFDPAVDPVVRVSTNVLQDDGARAIGTQLAHNPVYKAINEGQAFYGQVEILGKPYNIGYEPIEDSSGKIFGIYYVGYELP